MFLTKVQYYNRRRKTKESVVHQLLLSYTQHTAVINYAVFSDIIIIFYYYYGVVRIIVRAHSYYVNRESHLTSNYTFYVIVPPQNHVNIIL